SSSPASAATASVLAALRAPALVALAGAASTSSSTSSMIAIGAASPLRGPFLTIRVYPPLRLAKRGAIWSNRVYTRSLSRTTVSTRRRECRSPRLALVMSCSASGRSRLALVSVVVMRPCRNSDVARFASISRSCAGLPPRRGPLVGVGIGAPRNSRRPQRLELLGLAVVVGVVVDLGEGVHDVGRVEGRGRVLQ